MGVDGGQTVRRLGDPEAREELVDALAMAKVPSARVSNAKVTDPVVDGHELGDGLPQVVFVERIVGEQGVDGPGEMLVECVAEADGGFPPGVRVVGSDPVADVGAQASGWGW